MDKNYLQQLWSWTTSKDPSFEERYSFESWSEKLGGDEQYRSDFYSWVQSKDNTFSERRPFDNWSKLVSKPQEELTPEMMGEDEKKKDGESPSQDGVSADVAEEPVVEEEVNQEDEPVAEEPVVEEGLSDVITPKLMGKEEQEVVPFLNYQFGDEGFKFERSGIGDAMVAKSIDDEGNVVSEEEFDLDPFLTSTEVSESKKLQKWMSSQRASRAEAGIMKRGESQLVKFRNREQIATTLEEFSKEQEAFAESNKGLIADNMKYQEDLDKYNSMVSDYNEANVYDAESEAKIKAEADRIQAERDRLVDIEQGVKSTIEGYQKRSDLLKRSVGSFDKYMEDIDTPTGPIDATRKFIGGFYDNMIRGVGEWAAGESTFYVETALNALPVESYVSPEIIEQQRKEGLSDSQIKDEAIRTFKKELLPAVRTGMEEIIGSDTTEEYVKDMEENNYVLGSILGAAKSTPIMALHLASALSPMPAGKGGKALTIGQRIKKAFTSPVSILSTKFMGAQVADALDQEMANSPAFEGVSENEKMLVKYPVAIVSGLLEEYGASSIVNKTGLPQKLTLEILKKMGKGASAKTFKEFAEKEIKSRAARGGITFISGMLSEFETGGLQELATVGAKKIYSLQKEQEMFPEMDEQGNYVDSPKILSMQMAGQILDAAAREAIGGGFFSTIPALSSALSNDYYFNSISDEQFELFNSLINTKEGKIGVINDLKNKITAGEITQEEGKRMLDDVNKIQAALDKIPSDYSAANKKKALSLIMRQDAIKKKIDGKDKRLTKREQKEIDKIDGLLDKVDDNNFYESEKDATVTDEEVLAELKSLKGASAHSQEEFDTTKEQLIKKKQEAKKAEVTDQEVIAELTTRGLAATKENQKQVRFELEQEKKEAAPAEEVVVEEAAPVEDKVKKEVTIEPVDFEGDTETELDPYDASDKADKIAKDTGVGILRNKEIKSVATDSEGEVVGGLWTEVDGDSFSFDVAIDEKSQGQGVGEKLVNEAFGEFEFNAEANEDLKYNIEVTNPSMEKLLSKYGFVVDERIGGTTKMSHPTNNPKLETKTEQDAIQEPSTEEVDVQEPAEGVAEEAETESNKQTTATTQGSKEKEFNSFKKILNDMGYGSYEIDYLDENGNPVAYARGGKFNEFTTLEFIKIEDEYQGLGYSKFVYRDALEHANEQGSEGLMVGGQLLQESKSRATYKNFKNYEHSLKNERGNPYIVLTDFIKQQDAIQEPSTETVDVQEPARDSREVGEGDVRETAEEVDTEGQSPEAEAQVKQEADDLADALGLDDDVKFQLETEMTDKKRKEKLEKEADDLMNEVQPENVETIEDVEGVEPIPVNLEENVEPVERTGIKRFKLRDIIGKKLNLLMADKLKIELEDPSKPYNQETNPYVKMGGNFFPLMDKMFGKVAWASITDAATTKIIKGAMAGDLSAVYNMGDGGVDSNIAIPTSLDAALDKIFPPDNKGNVNPKKDEIFQLIKARVLKSKAKEIKKAHKHFKNASTIMEAFKSLTDEEVKVRAAVMNWVVPTSLSNVSTSIDLYNKLSDLGISIETLRDENAEQFAKDLPDGAITMIVEVQDENGVPVRERKLQLDKDLADKKITKRQYDKAINDVIQSAKMTLEQQNQEGVPSHPNYPVYIRGKAIALMEETASFFKIIPEYRQKFNERVSGIDKKKTGNVKEGATKVEESVYNQIKEAKKDSTSVEAKKEIIEALLNRDVKKLKSGKVKTETIALLKEALKLNNKAGIKEILAIAETPFAETTQYTAGGIRSADMTSGMTTSTTSYEIVEYLRDQHSRFLTRLSKSFPSVDVVLSQAEFDAIISDAQAKKLVLANQKVYGAVYEGKLYLNPNLPNYNTPIHEFGHVWLNVARELGKDTYKKGMELMTEDSPYYQQVINSKEYGKIIDKMRKDGVSKADIETYIKEEALATAIGDKGESFTSAAANKNFKNWLNELFEFIGKLTGISELTPDQLQNINLDEFVQGVVVDIMSENEVFAGAEVKSFGEQLQLMTVPEDSMTKIIEFGRAENFSDASIKELLKKRGFKVSDINNAMVVNIDIETQLPSEFNRVKGGVGEATQMFKDVRKKLSAFAKGKRKKLPAKKLTADEKRAKANELRRLSPSLFEMSDDAILKKFPEPAQYEAISSPTISEVREKAMELLKAHPIFQKQSAAVQGAILVGFDKTIGTRSNKKVQDVINNIKNKAKSMREGVKSIKEAQKELKAALKDMPMSQDIRRIIKAVGDINQDNVLAQLERVSELVDNIKSKEAVSDAQKRALQMKIDQLKKNAKALSSLKGDMRRFIRQSLPLSDMYSKAQLNKVAAIIDNINFDNQVNQVQKLFDIVEAQREKMKKATVKRMLDKAKKYATKSRKGKLVAKAGSVEAQGQAFFAEAAKILQYAYNNDTESMLKLAQELSDLDGIDEIVQKEINGEKLTQQEQALLDRVYAFDTFGDIMSMELEDVMTLEEAANDVKNESAVRLKNARLERSERYSKLSRESEAQIKKGFRELFTINGILKTKNQLNKSSKAIYEEFKRNGTVAAVKKLIDDIGYSNYNPISLIRNLMLHMGTMSTILDKGGKFFTDNIVTPLKDANENNLRGYQQQIQKLDELANAVKGIDGGFKQVMKLLKGKGMFVVGIETGTRADIDAIRAMVQQNPTDPKTLAKAKELISKAVKERMKYLTMSKSDIKAQMKAINETLDATTLIEEQVEYIDAISKLKQVDGMTLTKDQLLRIYALSKNDVQREKLKGQGFTDQRMAEIEAFLGPELIAFADNTVDYLSGQYYESVNDVHVRVNDVNLDFIDNYFPTRSLRGIKPTEYGADNFAKSFGQMSPSAISQRVDTKSGVDLTETFASALKGHLQQMEKYKSYAETVNTIQKILAFDHVDKLLDRTGLKKMYYLTIDNDVNPSSESMVFFQWLANRFYGMTLGFKLIQIPKQATSFINAYEQYSFFKDGKKKKLGGLGPDLMGFAYDYAKVLFFFRSNLKQARLNSATFNQRIIDAYQGDIFGLESGSQVTKEQRNQFIRWWNVASASPTTFGDALGVMGYMAVYNRNIANGMSPKEALKVFNDYNETQQSRRGTEASPIQVMAKKQPLLRMITMFSSTMLLQMNKVYQSSTNVMRDISNKKVPSKSDIRSIYLNVGLANVLFVLAGNIMKLIDGDDEDKEEVYTEMLRAMLFMNQLKKIPVIGSAIGTAEAMYDGKPPRSGIQGPLDRITYDVAKSIKDEKYGEVVKRAFDFGASTNLDMFLGIIQGTTEGFEDEVIYDTMGLPKSARPEGEKEKKDTSYEKLLKTIPSKKKKNTDDPFSYPDF